CFLARSQQVNVSGLVVSAEDNVPLPGVVVTVKNTTTGTTTDENGRYSIKAEKGDSLIFRIIGYVERHMEVGSHEVINITLSPVSTKLDETVIVGFGKKKRSDTVGSVSSVNPSDLKIPSSNLTTALAGRVPGMIAFQRSGEPGKDNAQFFIRGVTTFGYK